MKRSIVGKVIVITGASSGAGRCTALALARPGVCLALAARNEPVLEALAWECKDQGAQVLVAPTDVTDTDAVRILAAKVFQWKRRIDVWVNNAGVLAAGTFEEMPWEAHEQVISTNLFGYMRGAHAVLPYFKRQRAGILINNISIGGYVPVPFGGAYSASKFALRGFFEALRGELTGWPDIHIVDLFPPFLDTPGIRHAGNYTGRKLRPGPPVYDPAIVANAVKASIQNPKPVKYPGAATALLFKMSHGIAPELVVKLTGLLMKAYFKIAGAAPVTAGNLFNTVNYEMTVDRRSSLAITPKASRLLNVAVAVGLGIAAYLAAGRRTRPS